MARKVSPLSADEFRCTKLLPHHAEWHDPQQLLAAAATSPRFLAHPCLPRSFGPCTGITRLQRWERAQKLGLDPPAEVPAIVRRHGEDTSFNKDLFYQPY